MGEVMNVLIYARVSTERKKDKNGNLLPGQTVEPQLLELRTHCTRNDWVIVQEFTDTISGTKAARPGLDAMLARITQPGVDAVLCVKLDRIGRSVLNVAKLVEHFDTLGVAFICPGQGIDTRKSNPAGRFQLAMLAAVAALERDMISERTKAGLAVVRANGTQLGRPSKRLIAQPAPVIAKWRETRGTYRELAKLLGGISHAYARQLARESISQANA